MRCNAEGLGIIKRYEGFRAKPYLCPANVWSIGYGHTAGVNEKTPPVTEEEAEELLRRDLTAAEMTVTRMHRAPLNENQFSALVSLVFNIGSGNYQHSTLRALVNREGFAEAALEFPRWNKAGGKELAGLSRRRKDEQALFLKPGA